jgi:Uma2 family endonuclease
MSITQPVPHSPQATEPPQAQPVRLRMSYEEYLAWADEDTRAEWVAGEVIVSMPPKDLHQRLVEFLYYLLGTFIRLNSLGLLRIAPFEVKLSAEGPARQPDLMFLRAAHLDRLTPERVVGPPDLIIEVVSDDSEHRDRVDKFNEYEAAGVPEYWILDNRPQRRRAYFYRLGAEGQYLQVGLEPGGIYRSAVLEGFWLRVGWLWAPEPDPLRALAELMGPEQMAEALRRALVREQSQQ